MTSDDQRQELPNFYSISNRSEKHRFESSGNPQYCLCGLNLNNEAHRERDFVDQRYEKK